MHLYSFLFLLFFLTYVDPLDLPVLTHSFPPRRSSDLWRSLDLSWSMTFMDSKEPSVILRVRISTFSIESILSIRLQTHQLTHNVKTRQGDDWFRLGYLRLDAR